MSDEAKYKICRLVDQQIRIVGLPIDEALPVGILCGVGLFVGQLLVMMVIAVVYWFTIRHFKKGQGSSFLLNVLYWFLPGVIMSAVFKTLPTSSIRYWQK